MAIELEIEDGNPWYLSPNVWTADTDGNASLPVGGTPTNLWARVRNTGQSMVQNATVRFYWANPAVGISRATATPVGSSFVTLNGGETERGSLSRALGSNLCQRGARMHPRRGVPRI